MSTSFPHSTSNSQGNRSFAFDYDYYASDNKTLTIKWVGAGDGINSFGIDFTPTPILQYYNVYLEDSSTGLTHGPVRIEKIGHYTLVSVDYQALYLDTLF